MSDLSLGKEFPAPGHDDWLNLVEKTLKGADFDKRLVSHTYDGVRIEPLYHDSEHHHAQAEMPGEAPYRRGTQNCSTLLCQSFAHPDILQTNKEILEDLAGGVNAIRLKIDDGISGGIIIKSLSDMEQVLDGVFLDMLPVELDAGDRAGEMADLLSTVWQNRQITHTAQGAFLIDPIGLLAARGTIGGGIDTALEHAIGTAQKTASLFPEVTTLCADMRSYHLAGASEVQEIAIAAATGVAYLRAMEKSNMDLTEAARQISFLLNVDADVFLNIAKLRGFREIWSQITAACGIETQLAHIKLETAQRMMAQRDAWVNMLRVTTACFTANVAGAQSITIAPYTQALGLPNRFGRRIARNTHIVLQDEAHLGHVNDPAGGSWFIENLTDQLIEKAWTFFQEIEAEGGIVAALNSNMVQAKIADTARTRQSNITVRKETLVGVNEFPDIQENSVDFIKADARPSQTSAALPIVRLDHEFEALRAASDAHLAAHGKRPAIFLANLGTPSDFNLRATFAANFFAAGGIEPLSNQGFATPQEAAAIFVESGTKIAVLCANDAIYQQYGADTARALKAAGAKHLYHAGAGGALTADLEEAGVDTFITLGLDVIATLSQTHKILGVAGDE